MKVDEQPCRDQSQGKGVSSPQSSDGRARPQASPLPEPPAGRRAQTMPCRAPPVSAFWPLAHIVVRSRQAAAAAPRTALQEAAVLQQVSSLL
jgi:hypothetical protein